jgi:hypothetical protein
MEYPNLISTTIPQKDLEEIIEAINFINDKLPDLITLNSDELSALPKTGNDTIDFVLDSLKQAEENLDVVPKGVDLEEIKKDVNLILAIYKILDPLKKLEKKLEDSALLAGSEAYLPSIAIYNAIKADALRKRHVPQKVSA